MDFSWGSGGSGAGVQLRAAYGECEIQKGMSGSQLCKSTEISRKPQARETNDQLLVGNKTT